MYFGSNKKKKKRGFTLVETIITMALLSVVSIACIGILSSALAAKGEIDLKLKDQIALRQAILNITSDIRRDPEGFLYFDYDGNPQGTGPYTLTNNMIIRATPFFSDEEIPVVAKNIENFSIEVVPGGKAVLTIRSVGGQEVSTTIFLRVYS